MSNSSCVVNGTNFYPRPPRGGRPSAVFPCAVLVHFYPRPPRGGRLSKCSHKSLAGTKFLSTPSARRATPQVLHRYSISQYFYPRPPRGGRHYVGYKLAEFEDISIHALREEGDRIPEHDERAAGISIHALREEGDITAGNQRTAVLHFYPRPPRGGRLRLFGLLSSGRWHFYPRPPRGGRRMGHVVIAPAE